ncbi:hypothetical protein LROSL3_0257 [Furfurilactobacillus rossiae]|nr:hypothetical protein LROSL2_0256 [Furfurilactobacillus rossiae]QLE68039.1 hypothetical protein LROSL3_0257 [Furfurilactobacillus rossiae]
MKTIKSRLITTVIMAIVLFVSSNWLVTIEHLQGQTTGMLIRSSAFVILLYAWALVRLLSTKRFAKAFMIFVDTVYLMGFVSIIAIASTKLTGFIQISAVLIAIVGLLACLIIFYLIKKYPLNVVNKVN